jgi:hypothetical protein
MRGKAAAHAFELLLLILGHTFHVIGDMAISISHFGIPGPAVSRTCQTTLMLGSFTSRAHESLQTIGSPAEPSALAYNTNVARFSLARSAPITRGIREITCCRSIRISSLIFLR